MCAKKDILYYKGSKKMDLRILKTQNTRDASNQKNWGLSQLIEIILLQNAEANRKNSTFKMKTKLIFIFLTMFVFSLNFLTAQTWNYFKYQTFTQLANTGTNYQVRFTVHYGNGTDSGENVYLNSKCRTDFGDLRFFEGATELDYWMESKTDSDYAVFWVEIAGDLSTANRTVTLKYGNSSATTTSNGPNTFIFFDDFSNGLNKWTKEKGAANISIPSGQNYVRCSGSDHTVLGSSATYTGFANNAVEYRYLLATDAICEVGIRGDYTNNKGYKGRSDARTVTSGGSGILDAPYQQPWNFLTDAGEDFDRPTVNVWHRGTFTAYNSNLKLYRDGILKRSSTLGTYTTAGEISLQNCYGSYTDYDWVAVRKFAGSEPTRGNWGGGNVWQYTKAQTINLLANTGTNYQVRFTVHYGNGTDSGENVYLNSKCRTDFGDIRFFEGATELDYWMESKTDSDNAVFWVEIAGDLSTADRTVTLKYGNSFATTTSNGPNTFIFFDDFSNGLSKWTQEVTYGTISIPSGQNYVRCGGGTTTASPYGHTVLGSSATYTGFANNAVEYRYLLATDAICEVGIRGNYTNNTGYMGRSDARTSQGGSSILTKPYYDGWVMLTDAVPDGDVPSVGTWYRGTFTAYNSNLKLYRDGILKRSSTQGTYTTAGEISLQNCYGDHTDYDWVAVRKFADSEPTRGSWGSEQSLNNPLIEVSTTSLTNFTYVHGSGPSPIQDFTVSGSVLSANISIDAPADFEISLQPGANFTAQDPIVLSQSKGVIIPITIYVRLKAGLNNGTYTENINITSTGATDKSISCAGVVTANYPENTPVEENGVTITVSGGDANKGSGTIPEISNPNITEYLGFTFLLDDNINDWQIKMETSYTYGAYYQNNNWILGNRDEEYIVFDVYFSKGKGDVEIPVILSNLDPTLPVELSAFTLNLNSQHGVNVMWATQSETGLNGFYVYRGIVDDLSQAVIVSPLIQGTNTSQLHVYMFTDKEMNEPGIYYYWLEAQDYDGFVTYYGSRSIVYENGNSGTPEIPLVTGIRSLFPNPFNPVATIMYELSQPAEVKINIYNTRGQLVHNFALGQKERGSYKLLWEGDDNYGNPCGNGIYYIRMQAGKEISIKKAILMK